MTHIDILPERPNEWGIVDAARLIVDARDGGCTIFYGAAGELCSIVRLVGRVSRHVVFETTGHVYGLTIDDDGRRYATFSANAPDEWREHLGLVA